MDIRRLREWETQLRERRQGPQVEEGNAEPVKTIVGQIHRALKASGLVDVQDDQLRVTKAEITLRAEQTHELGAHVTASFFGFSGGLTGQHLDDNTHTISLDFTPNPVKRSDSSQQSGGKEEETGLVNALMQLKELIGHGEHADPDFVADQATVSLDFVVTNDLSVYLLASGGGKTANTHLLTLTFTR